MTRNNTFATLRSEIKEHLNNNTICTDVELLDYLSRSYRRWFEWYQSKDPTALKTIKDVTYTGEAESYDLSGSFSNIPYRIETVRDVTDGSPGVPLRLTDSLDSLKDMQYSGEVNVTVYGAPTHWFFYRDFTYSSGNYTVINTLLLAPIPNSARSLKVACQIEPEYIANVADSTGMPGFIEDLMVFDAAIRARVREGDEKSVAMLNVLYREAKEHATSQLKPPTRGPSRIHFDPRIID